MSRDGNDFLNLLGIGSNDPKRRSEVEFGLQIAFVDPSYSGTGRPKLRFAGESSVGSRLYPYLGSYTPAANDKVIVALFSHSGVILGKVV